MKKLGGFTMVDKFGWPEETLADEALRCAHRRGEMLGWTVDHVKAAGKEVRTQGDKILETHHYFEVFGMGETLEEMEAKKWASQRTEVVPNVPPLRPYHDAEDGGEQLTVIELRNILNGLPPEYDDFEVRYDSALGHILKEDFTIYTTDKKISLNG